MATSSTQLLRTPGRPAPQALAELTTTPDTTNPVADKTASWKLPAITKWSAGP